jgi:hypothetical protein
MSYAEYTHVSTNKGSSRGVYGSSQSGMGVRQPLSRQTQLVNPQNILQVYHTGELHEQHDPGLSSSSMSNRGMAPIQRVPSALPWAYNKIAYNSILSGRQTRRLPFKTDMIEDAYASGVSESTWMPTKKDDQIEAVVRTSNPYMPAAGGSSATVSSRDRKLLPYELDTRNYTGDGDNGGGAQGIEFIQLFNHPLLPNNEDESASDYTEAQVSIPSLLDTTFPEWNLDPVDRGGDDLVERGDDLVERILRF